MKSRLQLNLKPATIEKSLFYCLNDLGGKRGEQMIAPTEYHLMLLEICDALTDEMTIRQPKCGILFSGQFGTGKTTLMFGLKKFFDLIKRTPAAWTYQEIDSLENAYVRAEDFRYPIAYYEKFLEAASVPILFLDNLGIELENPKDNLAVELIRNLIRLRYDMRLFSMIATPFDRQSIREIYGNQIASIINDGYSVIEFDWKPFRKQS
ncbi:MAG: hypothetical protein BHV67_05560 [Bacteroidales bacterium 43_36]|nr:MAG: hypothetical protein BHV67_05560 [Bacteroidales bacterium 43_36]